MGTAAGAASTSQNADNANNGDAVSSWKRAGFVGMRGKKSEGADEEEDWYQEDDSDSVDYLGKRGSNTAFVGMRGKRPSYNGDDDEQGYLLKELAKRFGTSGFVGMRGKKMAEEEDSYALPPAFSKRAGFVGMRGKKWNAAARYWNAMPDAYAFNNRKMRRGGTSGFVGMRG
jgi:hypothetical protein